MALLKRLSIKWKLSFALISTGLILVTVYVLIAKRIFESDKISYVFDSQGSRLESSKSEMQIKIERILLAARSVIATFDYQQGKVSPAGEQLFKDEKPLLGLELWSVDRGQSLVRLEKVPGSLPPPTAAVVDPKMGVVDLRTIDEKKAVLTLTYPQAGGGTLRMQAAIDLANLLPKPSAVQSLLLVQGARIFAVSDLRGIDRSIFQSIAMEPTTTNSVTRIWEKGGLRFLVSEVPLGTADITLISMTPESEALGALNTLFRRSVVFLLFSFFGLIAIALSISRTLTGNIQLLTRSAEEIGRGNFEASPKIDSMDEMGVLARAFGKMSQEIKRLLFETSEKTRMEQELKTASLVQERLLPVLPQARLGDIEISGTVVTSSECGGDWWYYFQKQHELYVAIADATGHGTPAALITAAARSVFSRLEHEVLSLGEMMKAWDFAVSSCAQKQVFMTGIILRIDTRTGKGAYVNAAHESPFYFRQGEGEIACDYLISPSSQRIGDGGHDSMEEGVFELAPGEAIVLYTDGLFSVNRPDGKVLSEKRLGKKLAQKYQSVQSAPALMGIVLSEFNEFRGELPVPDDVSVVSLYRT